MTKGYPVRAVLLKRSSVSVLMTINVSTYLLEKENRILQKGVFIPTKVSVIRKSLYLRDVELMKQSFGANKKKKNIYFNCTQHIMSLVFNYPIRPFFSFKIILTVLFIMTFSCLFIYKFTYLLFCLCICLLFIYYVFFY